VIVNADSERLRQVIDNLIGNALQYTPPGSPVTVTGGPGRGAAFHLWPWRALAARLLLPWPSARAEQPRGHLPDLLHRLCGAACDT